MKKLLFFYHLFSIVTIIFSAPSSSDIHGVNWADTRDNYANDDLVLSGLSRSDSYSTIQTKANTILSTFNKDLGANAVRIPINPPTVTGDWWNNYKAAIDTAIKRNMKVILGYWEGPNGKDGKVDDLNKFWAMWKIVTDTYSKSSLVYFEVMNEPFGYKKNDWADLCKKWLDKFNVPHNRVLIGGTGYDDRVIEMGNDSRFSDCLLSQHIYPYWNTKLTTENQWLSELQKRIGNHAKRTVITEFGTEMDKSNGTFDYSKKNSGDHRIAFMRALVTYIHNNNMGCTVWPGLRIKDSYSVYSLKGNGNSISLVKNNESVVPLLRYAFGVSNSF